MCASRCAFECNKWCTKGIGCRSLMSEFIHFFFICCRTFFCFFFSALLISSLCTAHFGFILNVTIQSTLVCLGFGGFLLLSFDPLSSLLFTLFPFSISFFAWPLFRCFFSFFCFIAYTLGLICVRVCVCGITSWCAHEWFSGSQYMCISVYNTERKIHTKVVVASLLEIYILEHMWIFWTVAKQNVILISSFFSLSLSAVFGLLLFATIHLQQCYIYMCKKTSSGQRY